MGIVYFGSPALAVPPLKHLIEAGEDVLAIVTQPDTRRGRGGKYSPSPVKALALEHGIKSIEPRSMRDESFLAELGSYKPEFLVVVAYGKILTPEVLAVPTRASVNLHASMLPLYRGAAPINWAIINGDPETGVCTMFMSEGLDEGDVLLVERMSIGPEETAGELGKRMSRAGGPLIKKTLDSLRHGSLKGTPQEGAHTYARLLTKEDGRIDWSLGPVELANHIRGVNPWPGAFCYINGEALKVLRARRTGDCGARGVPGEVLRSDGGLTVACGKDECIEITELQPQGKRPMGAEEYLRGRHIETGTVLE